jgi:hypothetical protein
MIKSQQLPAGRDMRRFKITDAGRRTQWLEAGRDLRRRAVGAGRLVWDRGGFTTFQGGRWRASAIKETAASATAIPSNT